MAEEDTIVLKCMEDWIDWIKTIKVIADELEIWVRMDPMVHNTSASRIRLQNTVHISTLHISLIAGTRLQMGSGY